MKSRAFNNVTTKVLVLLVTALVITVIGSQIYRYVNDKHDTQEAVLVTINEDISFQGIIVRDETTLTYSGSDVLSYTYLDGSKVSEGDTVASTYDSEDSAAAVGKLESIEEEIEQLQRAQNPGTTDYVQPESISTKIDESYKELLSCAVNGDYSDFESAKSDMSLMMNIYGIISGISTDYNSRISELQSEMESIEASSTEAKDTITAPMTGYFVSHCDGYEDKLNTTNVLEMSSTDLEEVISGEQTAKDSVGSNVIGKMFENYTCVIAAVMDTDSRVAEDANLSLKLETSDKAYDVTVLSVKEADEDGKSVVYLSCDILDDALVANRIVNMQLIFDEYSGIKVSKSAIRFQGEQKGVYVILGQEITFKKIDVIYDGDDFAISKNTSDEDYLLLYDQILMEVVTEEDVQASSSESSDVSGDT